MKIGKNTPAGAFYSIPEANNKFAAKDDIVDIENVVSNLEEQTELLADSVSGVADAVRDLDEMIPTPTEADEGKVLTANASGGYDVEEIPIPDISSKMDKENPTGTGVVSIGRTGNVGTYSVVIGTNSSATKTGAVTIGKDNVNTCDRGLTIGYNASNEGTSLTTVIGDSAKSYASSSTIIGSNCTGASYERTVCCGIGLIASRIGQIVLGQYNVTDSSKRLIIGKGTANTARSNFLTVDMDGNFEVLGTVNGIPHAPTTDGTYNLQVTVTNGEPAYSWVAV